MRVAGERHGDDHALLLPAAELVGVAPANSVWIGKADVLEQFYASGAGGVRAKVQVLLEHLFDLWTDPHRRIERGDGVLIDHRDAIAPQSRELSGR